MNNVMPSQESIYEMLSPLFGDDLAVKKLAAPQNAPAAFVAMYVHEDQSPGAAALCSREFSAFVGAALSMLPAGAAKDTARNGMFTEMMVGNLYEVMNICSRLLFSDTTPHLKLTKLTPPSEATNLEQLQAGATTAEFEISIPKYGTGRLGFLIA